MRGKTYKLSALINNEELKIMIIQSLAGFFVFAFIAWCLSENRRKFPVRIVLVGMLGQVILAFMCFHIPVMQQIFALLNRAVETLQESTLAGTSFVFGYWVAEKRRLTSPILRPRLYWHFRRCRWFW